ncbi:MAG: cysteine--tRNA ligase [Candidatus Methylacidiphilales bacterium]
MPIRLFDTLSRHVLPLSPARPGPFRIYCCGPTVYGPAHIGNFRTFILQDVLRRTLEVTGTPVRHVRNVTDVDDKTIRQSMAEGRSLAEFTAAWTERFHRDAAALNLLPPTIEPSAVAHIPQQITMIERLVASGHAYVSRSGSVYFNVASFPAYGRLSRLQEREVQAGASGAASVTQAEDHDEYDRETAADFALWKARKPEDGPNFWSSPWGDGRPGWHIECSAMATEYLGTNIDLHSGGIDLIFPHHENEIAQSECATGETFVRHWFHVAHLTVDRQKMSKSLGNLYTVEDVVARGFTPTELRYLLLSGHYRKPLNFTWDSLGAARRALEQIIERAQRLDVTQRGDPPSTWGRLSDAVAALEDDLNTPKALGALFTVLDDLDANDAPALAALLYALGLQPEKTEAPAVKIPEEVRALAEARWSARATKNWAESDRLRDELLRMGWRVLDSKEGYRLEPVPR